MWNDDKTVERKNKRNLFAENLRHEFDETRQKLIYDELNNLIEQEKQQQKDEWLQIKDEELRSKVAKWKSEFAEHKKRTVKNWKDDLAKERRVKIGEKLDALQNHWEELEAGWENELEEGGRENIKAQWEKEVEAEEESMRAEWNNEVEEESRLVLRKLKEDFEAMRENMRQKTVEWVTRGPSVAFDVDVVDDVLEEKEDDDDDDEKDY